MPPDCIVQVKSHGVQMNERDKEVKIYVTQIIID